MHVTIADDCSSHLLCHRRVIQADADSPLPHSCVLVNFMAGISTCHDPSDELSDTTDDDCCEIRPGRRGNSLNDCQLEDFDATNHDQLAVSPRLQATECRAPLSRRAHTGLTDSSTFHTLVDRLGSMSHLTDSHESSKVQAKLCSSTASIAAVQGAESRFVAPRRVAAPPPPPPRFVQSLSLPAEKSLHTTGSQDLPLSPVSNAALCCREPFWVLVSPASHDGGVPVEGGMPGCWMCPDDFSLRLLNKAISEVDKQVFWEMLFTLCSYPTLQDARSGHDTVRQSSESTRGRTSDDHSTIGQDFASTSPDKRKESLAADGARLLGRLLDPRELATLLSRVECRVLWTEAAVQLVPAGAMQALIRATFTASSAVQSHPPSGPMVAAYDTSSPNSRLGAMARRPPTDLRFSSREVSAGHLRRHTLGTSKAAMTYS